MPLIIKWPGRIKPNSTSDVPVSGVDFYPTLVKIAGGKPASNLDGEDIFTLLRKRMYERDLFWHFPAYLESYKKSGEDFRSTPYSSIRSGDWKLIYYYESQSMELFNLKKDLGENRDFSDSEPIIKEELYQKLMAWLKQTKAPIPTELNPDYLGDK